MFWSQHLGCWGQNTSRIQNKEVYATLCLQANTARTKHMENELEDLGRQSKQQITTLQSENQGLSANVSELEGVSRAVRNRLTDETSKTDRLEAKLDLVKRELESRTHESREMTITMLSLKDELATQKSLSETALSNERTTREQAERTHGAAVSEANTERQALQQEAQNQELQNNIHASEIENLKLEVERQKRWTEENAGILEARMSEQRKVFEERVQSERDKGQLEVWRY